VNIDYSRRCYRLFMLLIKGWADLFLRRVRLALAGTAFLSLLACDTMHADRMRIVAPPTVGRSSGSTEAVLEFVRATLAASDFSLGPSSLSETWVWRDPSNPPGVRATLEPASDGWVRVRLSQDLYGPIGKTEKYRSIKKALVEGARSRFGRSSVVVEACGGHKKVDVLERRGRCLELGAVLRAVRESRWSR